MRLNFRFEPNTWPDQSLATKTLGLVGDLREPLGADPKLNAFSRPAALLVCKAAGHAQPGAAAVC